MRGNLRVLLSISSSTILRMITTTSSTYAIVYTFYWLLKCSLWWSWISSQISRLFMKILSVSLRISVIFSFVFRPSSYGFLLYWGRIGWIATLIWTCFKDSTYYWFAAQLKAILSSYNSDTTYWANNRTLFILSRRRTYLVSQLIKYISMLWLSNVWMFDWWATDISRSKLDTSFPTKYRDWLHEFYFFSNIWDDSYGSMMKFEN